MEANLYTQRLTGPIRWLMVAAAIFMLGATLPAAMRPGWGGTALFVVVAIACAALLNMRATILVAPDEVHISVFSFSETIPYRDIRAVDVGPATALKEGAGLRAFPNGLGYIVGGPTVRITTRTTEYLASAKHPDVVVKDIRARL